MPSVKFLDVKELLVILFGADSYYQTVCVVVDIIITKSMFLVASDPGTWRDLKNNQKYWSVVSGEWKRQSSSLHYHIPLSIFRWEGTGTAALGLPPDLRFGPVYTTHGFRTIHGLPGVVLPAVDGFFCSLLSCLLLVHTGHLPLTGHVCSKSADSEGNMGTDRDCAIR